MSGWASRADARFATQGNDEMPEENVTLNYVESCNLGKLGADGVALRINFATSAGEVKAGPNQHAVFGLSRELARGLQKALSSVLDETP